MRRGISSVLEIVSLEKKLNGCDLVVTGDEVATTFKDAGSSKLRQCTFSDLANICFLLWPQTCGGLKM